MTLEGVSVLVAGAGLAGLSAAHDLVAMGAEVTVVDARDRVGGRVLTIRDGFKERQHAEAGGDMIDEGQREICDLARELGLKLAPILRSGFGYVRQNGAGIRQSRPASRAARSLHGSSTCTQTRSFGPRRSDCEVSSSPIPRNC